MSPDGVLFFQDGRQNIKIDHLIKWLNYYKKKSSWECSSKYSIWSVWYCNTFKAKTLSEYSRRVEEESRTSSGIGDDPLRGHLTFLFFSPSYILFEDRRPLCRRSVYRFLMKWVCGNMLIFNIQCTCIYSILVHACVSFKI